MTQISGNGDYDPDKDTPDVENNYTLYSNSSDEEPTDLMSHKVYDSSDDESGVNDEAVCGMNYIRWSETAEDYEIIKSNIDVEYNRSDEW